VTRGRLRRVTMTWAATVLTVTEAAAVTLLAAAVRCRWAPRLARRGAGKAARAAAGGGQEETRR
jgi:hypothetical protein